VLARGPEFPLRFTSCPWPSSAAKGRCHIASRACATTSSCSRRYSRCAVPVGDVGQPVLDRELVHPLVADPEQRRRFRPGDPSTTSCPHGALASRTSRRPAAQPRLATAPDVHPVSGHRPRDAPSSAGSSQVSAPPRAASGRSPQARRHATVPSGSQPAERTRPVDKYRRLDPPGRVGAPPRDVAAWPTPCLVARGRPPVGLRRVLPPQRHHPAQGFRPGRRPSYGLRTPSQAVGPTVSGSHQLRSTYAGGWPPGLLTWRLKRSLQLWT
jgi:hypothetical protein